MCNRFLTILSLALSASVALPQQPAARQVAPRAPAAPGPSRIYLYAYATPDPEGPTVHCKGRGIDCAVDARLLTASRHTPAHDATLSEATAAINRVLGSLVPPPGKTLCLYRSIHGPVLVWSKVAAAGAAGAADLDQRVPAQAVTEPQAIANLLGVQSARRRAGGNRKAQLIWDPDLKHYVWSCSNPGSDCVIHASLNSAARTASHDDRLAAATTEINRILDQAAARAPRPDQSLCMLFTPDGPMLAWTFPTDRPGRVVSSESPEFRRAAREALGLAP